MLQKGEGFFMGISDIKMLDMLVDKLEQIVDKEAKQKAFKDYQDGKKEILIQDIKERFKPSIFEIQ